MRQNHISKCWLFTQGMLVLQKVCRGNHGAHQKTLLEPILVRNVRKREEGVQIRIDLAMDQEA